MTEEEKRMRDNIALVAMQCLLNQKPRLSLGKKLYSFFFGECGPIRSPLTIAACAYNYAQAMMAERRYITKKEEE